jgi:hypothetical protein
MPTLWRALRGHPATRTRRRSGRRHPRPLHRAEPADLGRPARGAGAVVQHHPADARDGDPAPRRQRERTAGENALRLADGRPVLVGPVTLARRFNAVATTEPSDPSVDARRAVDPLQPTDFTGAWTLGSIAALAAAGVPNLCYCGHERGCIAARSETTVTRKRAGRAARHRWIMLGLPPSAMQQVSGLIRVSGIQAVSLERRRPGYSPA